MEDYNKDGSVKLASLIKIMENAGNKHSDSIGDSILTSSNNGLTWILTDWYIEIEAYPKYGEKLMARTWSQTTTTTFGCSRDFELYADDRLCIKATTRWVLLNLQTGKPTPIPAELFDRYGSENKSVFESPRLPKNILPKTFSSETKLQLRRNDIDFNNHVHNLTYLDFAMEAIPEDLYKNHKFTNIRMSYKSAITDEKEIICKYNFTENKHIVHIFNNDGELKTIIELI